MAFSGTQNEDIFTCTICAPLFRAREHYKRRRQRRKKRRKKTNLTKAECMSSSVCKFGTQKSPQNITVTSSSETAEMACSVLTQVANAPRPNVSYVLVASLNASDFDTRLRRSSRFARSSLTRFTCSAIVNIRALFEESWLNSFGLHTEDASSRQMKNEPFPMDAFEGDFGCC